MSASILYHIHGLNGVKYNSTQFINETTIITATLDQSNDVCPNCKSSNLHFKGNLKRVLQMCPTGVKPCWLHLDMRRRKCVECLHKWQPKLAFASGQRRMIRSFERYIIRLTASMTIKDVANHLKLSWRTVRDIHKEYLKRKYSKPITFKELIYLGMDEFSIGKGHDYMTIFINLDTAQIIHAVEGRSREVVIPFLRKIKKKLLILRLLLWI
jgi:transposase